MPKFSISLPKPIIFSTNLSVQIGDINYGNHLGNDAVLRFCHEARIRWLKMHHLSEMDVGGSGLIMIEANIQYKAQSHYGDQLKIELGMTNINRCGFTILYHLFRLDDEKTIAQAQTTMVCFDYSRQKICTIPMNLAKIIG